MADVHSKEIRSYNMSKIKGKDTKPEILVRKFLFTNGLRYRLHDKKLPGKPDIILSKYRTVVFIHGCFWHGHKDCKYFVIPKTRTEWWKDKINTNIFRDHKVNFELQQIGWNVLTIWECELKAKNKEENLSILLERITNNLIEE